MKNHGLARSHISVLVDDEDVFKRELGSNLKEEQVLSDAKGGATLLSRNTVEEEEKLPEEHVTEDVDASKEVQPSHFTKLDQLLTQAHLFSEMVMEKMDDIDRTGPENDTKDTISLERDVEDVKEKKKGRGSKRKAPTNFNSRKVTRAVGAMLARSTEGPVSEDLRNYKEDKMAEEQAELVPLLTGGRLKPYQIKGVKWLISLWQNGLNGILADEMGLGKTLQTIAFLAHLKGNGLHGPYLVIAPLSTLSNWAEEISRFVPSMNAVIYHGNSKIRSEIRRKHMPRNISADFPIVITSYEVAMIDAIKYLKFYHWKYIVVDEGHRLKNSECKLLSELKLLPVENKLLLSGTPLQNNLKELWSLLNFILPDVFPSVTEFESWFNFFGESNNDNVQKEVLEKRRTRVVAKLHSILRPFLLRRMKEDVEQMLPRKKEIILYATLSEHQKVFQDHLLNKTLESHLQEVKNGYGMKGKLQNLMVQLRKNCNHPDLIASEFNHSDDYPPVDQIVEQCGKFQLLDKLVKQLLSRKHKVLIFSQWTKILDIMDYYFSEINMEVFRIDGSVELPERQRQIQEFQDVNSNCRIFLLSTRAGGMGINLTAADSCILYDSDWNPQMDLQAMNRCHRIGQTKPVHVYRLATAQSVEGRILKRAFSKLRLEHVVIGKGQFMQEVNRSKITDIEEEEDVLALLRDQEDEEDKMIQTTISDADLERVLDRSDLVAGTEKEDGKPQFLESVIPLKGPGWEVVVPPTSGGMLTTVNN